MPRFNIPLIAALVAFALCGACQSSGGDAQNSDSPAEKTTNVPDAPPAMTLAEQAREAGFDADYIMGKFNPAEHPDFVVVDQQYADRSGLYLRQEVYDAFLKMRAAAAKEGLTMTIRSATRNFDYQKGIWERKWTGARKLSSGADAAQAFPDPKARALEILKYSSMPGTSRHHWGTDLDLNAFNNEYFETGPGQKLYAWMQAHAAEYGFCQPYSPKGEERPHGYNEEKWHWSYLPTAQPLTALARESLSNGDIEGFKGADVAGEIDVVRKYVLGINPECLP
ncbi:MAG TPA: M15 family metallopeptidase [Phaeodactylibacter sp.]|nr:M15 family metallopeptidase [Phaeodactylibacter sp.]